MGCGCGLVPEGLTRLRKGKKASSLLGNGETLEMKEGMVMRREKDLKFTRHKGRREKMKKK